MFKYIDENKLRYEKGQLAPFFIAVLVIIIIMAMITVNLGKIGSIKTDSANAVDAGALAGGSIMAGVFNGQAVMNSYMIVAYKTFWANLGMAITLTITSMVMAAAACAAAVCPPEDPCCGSAKGCYRNGIAAIVSIIAISAATFFFWWSQRGFVENKMKDSAKKGRHSAIKAAFQFAFINSGISGKLIHGAPVDQMRGTAYNYSDTFSDFIKNEMPEECGAKDYAPTDEQEDNIWMDGQGREHKVHVDVYTQDVDHYIMRYSVLCLPSILLLDGAALILAWKIPALCASCPCTAGAIAGIAAAAGALLLAALAGLLPFGGKGDLLKFVWCWVDDIIHNRLFTVKTTQTHGSYDYGLWKMVYPTTTSKSEVDFRGNGKIYKPKPKFDASIVRIDEGVTQ